MSVETPRAARARVLVVDDDNGLRHLVVRALRGRGYEVTEAANGKAGVEQVQAAPGHFDIILLDYHMPVMDGVSACRDLRRSAPVTPVIMMSTDSHCAELCDEFACTFLPKPFETAELLDSIDRHLDTAADT